MPQIHRLKEIIKTDFHRKTNSVCFISVGIEQSKNKGICESVATLQRREHYQS